MSSNSQDPVCGFDGQLDGDEQDPICVCGFSIKFPQDATSPDAFWKMLVERRCAMTEFPKNRLNIEGFYKKERTRNTFPARGGHFIAEDIEVFDADFFSLSPAEVSSIDPMQRWLLETAFHALENAGIPMEKVSGSATSVYAGCFGSDYMIQLYRDAETLPAYGAVGIGLSMLANRLSWFFNLKGPSITMDSACSSSLMALDIACQALRGGACDMSIVAGTNLTFAPEIFTGLSNISFLSPDSRCYSFDHRANGYARGEGIAVVILKRLSDAIRDGNTIRAVIRATGSNEDGRTSNITQPSSEAQEQLIRATYKRAKLSMAHTRYVEAHGTGTATGDPREANAIGLSFREHRSQLDPVYIGAVKSNIGHLEGASGLAGLIKAVLVLERGTIPPNTNFEKLNSQIDSKYLRITFPEQSHTWPIRGLRRASVNSFGYGGANCHVVLDDAYHYLHLRGLKGNHCTTLTSTTANDSLADEASVAQDTNIRLFVWSAADYDGLARITAEYENHDAPYFDSLKGDQNFLSNLAYTLDSHRSHLTWRSYALLRSPSDIKSLASQMSSPQESFPKIPRIGFVFTGQGAQWFAMGRELTKYMSFRFELESAERYLRSIGCKWSVREELGRSESTSKIDDPEISQALTTVLQVALVKLVRGFGLRPTAVVGHSSGEIAAAFAGGYISSESAWKLAYLRGFCAATLINLSHDGTRGAMMAVGMPENDASGLLEAAKKEGRDFGVSIACVNSPRSVTVAGEEDLIDKLKLRLDEQKVFARKLRVGVAYHSDQMKSVASKLESMIGSLNLPPESQRSPMVSTVTGQYVATDRLCEPSYWALNMTSQVQFSKAIETMCASSGELASQVDHIVEIGPHAALQGPIRETLKAYAPESTIGYSSFLRRNQSADESLLQAVGQLHSIGLPLDLRAVNEPTEGPSVSRSLLTFLPEYPFNHSKHYWHEGQLSQNYRHRTHAPTELLGTRSREWDSAEPRWYNHIRTSDTPWLEQHVVDGANLFPASSMLVMAIEAARQIHEAPESVEGYILREVQIEAPVDLSSQKGHAVEVRTTLQTLRSDGYDQQAFRFTISSRRGGADWLTNCQGIVAIEESGSPDSWARKKTTLKRKKASENFSSMIAECASLVESDRMYDILEQCGLRYGPLFRRAQNQTFHHKKKHASAHISLFQGIEEGHVVHPASLDAVFHLAYTALTSGGREPITTCVPARIGSLWVSSTGLSWPGEESVLACTDITETNPRGFLCRGAALAGKGGSELRLWFEDLEVRNVTNISSNTPARSRLDRFCMFISQRPALNMLEPKEIESLLNRIHPARKDGSTFPRDLRRMIIMSLNNLLQSVNESMCNELWQRKYFTWAKHHTQRARRTQESDSKSHGALLEEPSLEELSENLRRQNECGAVYSTVALNLLDIFQGRSSPIELLFQNDLLRNYYEEAATYRPARMIASYMDMLAHRSPGLRILELGGGTGSGTRNIIQSLHARQGEPTRSLRCERYDFTDISPAFLETARGEFPRFHSQMTFKVLDIERDFTAQGFQAGQYDVVIAVSTLHVASNLAQTLLNVRKTLKPGGKLIIQESFETDGWSLGFIFGLFPGWWAGSEDNRSLSPNLDLDGWDTALKESGFSGNELVLEDRDDDPLYHYGWIVSTAIESDSYPPNGNCLGVNKVVLVVNDTSEAQEKFANALFQSLKNFVGLEPSLTSLDSLSGRETVSEDELFVFLAEYKLDFLGYLDERSWAQLQSLIGCSHHLLWVLTVGDQEKPGTGLIDGLVRTLRQEDIGLHLVTLALDSGGLDDRHMASKAPYEPYEQEYREVDGILHSRRLEEAHGLRSMMDTVDTPFEVVPANVDASIRFTVSETRKADGFEAYLAEDCTTKSELPDDCVEVAVKSMRLQSRGPAVTESQAEPVGRFFSGVVSKAGKHSGFSSHDRVFAACQTTFRSHVQVPPKSLVKLSADQTFSQVASVVPPVIISYHLLVQIGNIHANSAVLLHSIPESLRLGILAIVTNLGVSNIWTMAQDVEEAGQISDDMNIPQERILPRNWLTDQPALLSEWRTKFDLILMNEADRSLIMRYVSPGGRCIVLRQKGHLSLFDDSHNIDLASQNASIHFVDFDNINLSTEILRDAVAVAMDLGLKQDKNTAIMSASDLPSTLERLRKAPYQDVVVTLEEPFTANIAVEKKHTLTLDAAATYLVAGAFGGIGRAIVRWLVNRGARHLILLSRSGPQTEEAQKLLSEISTEGVNVEAPCCDVTDESVLRLVLKSCSARLPQVKGCIITALVMTESIFENMKFHEWKTAVDSKAKASWNLHTVLPNGLDFFVMTSSAMALLGMGSLAGYNAGNTFQDELARLRVSQGERAVALDLGGISDVGYLTNHQKRMDKIAHDRKLVMMPMDLVCVLLDIYCDPKNTQLSLDGDYCQPIFGILPPSDWKHNTEIPHTMMQPLWGHMHHLPAQGDDTEGNRDIDKTKSKGTLDTASRLAIAKTCDEAADIVSGALAQRVSALLGIANDGLDQHNPIYTYGIDSLSAIDLRNWIAKVFAVDVPVFDILGRATFASVGMEIAKKIDGKMK
ncbi:putative polyketide synthase [Hypoxylon trugodes]|uniref:putative polyketide synthase n=1 Tax=Hypoxylon trugodes TaxID=326681 RepID=UPI002197003C|nr:putative polyketide synthase [Hypoxylon trugodes]KAI1389501.1 putative polyketide synthase [Hypoxylon trugodes]